MSDYDVPMEKFFAHEMKVQSFRNFTPHEFETWKMLYDALEDNRKNMVDSMFPQGIETLKLSNVLPDLNAINKILFDKTKWLGIPVEGLEEGLSFYPALAQRQYPIGNFIRDQLDLGYTPAPDIFHDLYGHLPFLVDLPYANFCADFGKLASKYLHQAKKLQAYERFFWFTIEFALIESNPSKKIFGAGILSSKAESIYALSSTPQLKAFNIKDIIEQDFKVDEFQKVLFVLKSKEQLYQSLGELESQINLLLG